MELRKFFLNARAGIQWKYYLTMIGVKGKKLIIHRKRQVRMKVLLFENGPFMVNTYLVVNEKTNGAFILDPGSELDSLLDTVRNDNISIGAIVCTHAHIDHVAGADQVQRAYLAPLYLNSMEQEWVKALPVQARMFGVPDPGIPTIDRDLPASGTIELAGMSFALLHTPGHSPGSISLYADGIVFSGDALFNMSIGRTDLPGGDYQTLIKAIQEKLFTLPGDTRVFCGHGPDTTIAQEKRMNPFF